MTLRLLAKVSCGRPAKDEAIPKIQTAQRQVSEYQEGGMPFGLGHGLAPIGTGQLQFYEGFISG
jgi:hypothetical protein